MVGFGHWDPARRGETSKDIWRRNQVGVPQEVVSGTDQNVPRVEGKIVVEDPGRNGFHVESSCLRGLQWFMSNTKDGDKDDYDRGPTI